MDVDAIKSLLVGSYQGQGVGGYPNISSFEYLESVVFILSPKGFLEYRSNTRSKVDGTPMHTECGYLRVISPEAVELVIAQPTGIAEVGVGSIVVDNDVVAMRIEARPMVSPTAKFVGSTLRELRFGADGLEYSFSMETDKVELTWHLTGDLSRIEGGR
ncbi:MAG: FABP family protein [Actinomycetota bacterium]|nr:FABP family protein [Actinomycetota bacterium]